MITITMTESRNPDSFFKTRNGLWVSDDFRSLVVAKARPTNIGAKFKIEHTIIAGSMSGIEIEAMFWVNFFDESVACANIAQMVSEQFKGEEGKMLNNGCANLFYTRSCVVNVNRATNYRWGVRPWSRGGHRWNAGDQVFSLVTTT